MRGSVRLALRAGALLLGGAVVGFVGNAARRDGVSLRGFEAPVSCSADVGGEGHTAPATGVAPLALVPRDASLLCGTPGVVFADTRPLSRFEEGHLADAVHLPCDASEAGAEAILAHLADATTVVVYGDSSDDGRRVAESLANRGLRARLYVLTGGFGAWETEGLACASGPSHGGPTSLTSIVEKRP